MITKEEKVEKQKRFYSLVEEYEKITNTVVPLRFGVDVIRLQYKENNMYTDISLKDHLAKKYGKRASDIMEELVNMGCVD